MTDEGGGASRTTEPAAGTSAATDVSLREHLLALRAADIRFQNERDRRYTELQAERDRALIIKSADQAYRDEKANDLRDQISRERGEYASKTDLQGSIDTINATLKPLVEFVAAQQGVRQGGLDLRQAIAWVVAFILGAWAIFQAATG